MQTTTRELIQDLIRQTKSWNTVQGSKKEGKRSVVADSKTIGKISSTSRFPGLSLNTGPGFLLWVFLDNFLFFCVLALFPFTSHIQAGNLVSIKANHACYNLTYIILSSSINDSLKKKINHYFVPKKLQHTTMKWLHPFLPAIYFYHSLFPFSCFPKSIQ